MITPAIKYTANLLLERRSRLPVNEQKLWLWYFFSENPMWKHHSIDNKPTAEEIASLVEEYNGTRSNRSNTDARTQISGTTQDS